MSSRSTFLCLCVYTDGQHDSVCIYSIFGFISEHKGEAHRPFLFMSMTASTSIHVTQWKFNIEPHRHQSSHGDTQLRTRQQFDDLLQLLLEAHLQDPVSLINNQTLEVLEHESRGILKKETPFLSLGKTPL